MDAATIRDAQRRLLRFMARIGVRVPADYGPRDVDGVLGPRTRTALVFFQSATNRAANGAVLRSDGALDDGTLAALRGDLPQLEAGDAGDDAHVSIARAASALASVAPDVVDPARIIFLGQVKAESDFGNAFTTPDGSNSNNWGAIYAPGDRGTIPVGDTSDGKPFTAKAAWNSTPEAGARQFVTLIRGSYPKAYAAALAGDVWAYAQGLFRDGHGYFGGFPPGHKWSLAPAGTPLHSPLDHYWRIAAYARMVMGSLRSVAAALGVPVSATLREPPPPASSGGNADGLPAVGIALMLWRLLG
jgi:hypothetical protein